MNTNPGPATSTAQSPTQARVLNTLIKESGNGKYFTRFSEASLIPQEVWKKYTSKVRDQQNVWFHASTKRGQTTGDKKNCRQHRATTTLPIH